MSAPITEAELAPKLLDWARHFVKRSQQRIDDWSGRSDELTHRRIAAQAVEEHRKRAEYDYGLGMVAPTETQQLDTERAQLDAELVNLQIGHANNLAMVAFIERLVADLNVPRPTHDDKELAAFKAERAAVAHAKTLVLAEADTWPYHDLIWKQGWALGYLARMGEKR